jgi:GAF domain-containing protein
VANGEHRALLEMADLAIDLEHRPIGDVQTLLDDLVLVSMHSVAGAQYAGITVVGRGNVVNTVSSSHHHAVRADDALRRHRQGPCLSFEESSRLVRIEDLAAEPRWPRYRDEVLETTPLRSALCIRMCADGRTTSAVTFYAEQAHAFDDDSEELALIVTAQDALVWNLIRRQEQFTSALASRDTIGQAKGILMERFDIDAADAFSLLKRMSQQSNVSVGEISHGLVRSRHPGP